MSIKKKDNKQVRILSIDCSDIYRAMHRVNGQCGLSLRDKNGNLNTDKMRGFIDISLDLEEIKKVSLSHKQDFPRLFQVKDGDTYTTALVNVTFDYTLKAFYNKTKYLFVKDGYDVEWDDISDHVCVINENGMDVLIAIEVFGERKIDSYMQVEKPLNKEVLGDYFYYDKEKKVYNLVKSEKTNESLFDIKEDRHAIRKDLYENGFDVDGIHYVRYKRSAGSSREGHCLFVAEPLYDDMMKWSLCGIDKSLVNDQTAFQAYISLTLSGMEKKIYIPRQSILVIKDQISKFTDRVIKVSEDENGLVATNEDAEIENVIWDGEALLDHSIFTENGYEKEGMMLLRNRFFKTCAFNTNLQKWFADNDITMPSQLNGYYSKKTRSIKDIKLVITESSFKYIKFKPEGVDEREWLEKWLDNIYADKKSSMFGVVKTDKPSGPMKNKMVWTNYQLLNTLALTREDTKELLKESFDYLHSMQNDPMYLRYYSSLWVQDEYSGEDTSTALNYRQKLISDIMRRTDDFEGTRFYRNYRTALSKSFKEKLKHGRIMIDGGYHTLLGNGLEFLHAIIDKSYKVDMPIGIKDREIYTPKFKDGEKLLCQRSPHITMGNILVAENKYVEEIEKYFNFGEAKSIVYVNAIRNNLQQRLNGCDYDADAMLITNNALLYSVASKCYDNFPVPFCAVMPSGRASYTDSMKDLALLDIKISENKIGEIVNLSQFLNSIYWQRISNGKAYKDEEELYADICKLAVLSGIEIDKAKRLFPVSADAVLAELRKYKDDYKKNNGGKIPEFFAFITENEKAYEESTKEGMNTAMSYVYDAVGMEKQRANPISNVTYNSLFLLEFDKKDPTGAYSKRRDSVLEFIKERYSEIRRLNFISKNKSHSERSLANKKMDDLFEECKEKIKKVADDHLYYLLLSELDKNEESSKGVSSFNALLFATLCYANDGYLMKKLKKPTKELYDLIMVEDDVEGDAYIFGHPHIIGRVKENKK